MNTSTNNYDSLEQIIFKNNLKIINIDFNNEFDTMIVLLNSDSKLSFKLTLFPALYKSTKEQVLQYNLIAGGLGVHFTALDEDYSLKGFLKLMIENNTLTPGNIQYALAA